MKYNLPINLNYENLNRYVDEVIALLDKKSYDIIVNMQSNKDIMNSFMYSISCNLNSKHIISTYEYNSIIDADDDICIDELKEKYINGYNDIQNSYMQMIDEDTFEYEKMPKKYLRFFKEINWAYVNSCSFDDLVEMFNMKDVLVITETGDINISSTNIYKLGVSHVDVLCLQ